MWVIEGCELPSAIVPIEIGDAKGTGRARYT